MSPNEILLDNSKTPEEKVYLIASAIKDSGQSIDDILWYAILELKDKNFPFLSPEKVPRYISLNKCCSSKRNALQESEEKE